MVPYFYKLITTITTRKTAGTAAGKTRPDTISLTGHPDYYTVVQTLYRSLTTQKHNPFKVTQG